VLWGVLLLLANEIHSCLLILEALFNQYRSNHAEFQKATGDDDSMYALMTLQTMTYIR
jgi:hypothetical protein